jgi:TonB family protein
VPLLNLPFPKEADKQKIDQANVSLRFVVSESGEPSRFEVMRGHPAFDQATIDAIKKMKFSPGTLHGKPRAAYMQLTVQYRR